MKKAGAFALMAFALAVSAFGAGIPTPLYLVYVQEFHFTSGILGIVFAVYAAGVLVTLFFLAPLSDAVGRRPVLVVGMLLTGLSGVVFIISTGIGWLILARILSGL
jgi:MFS family permease